jgi:outer membrane receptor protein involved in Fe transport
VSYVAPGGRWELALHGSNLLNAYYRISGYTIAPLGLDNGTLGRPREWGVTLNYRFD